MAVLAINLLDKIYQITPIKPTAWLYMANTAIGKNYIFLQQNIRVSRAYDRKLMTLYTMAHSRNAYKLINEIYLSR